MLPANQAGAANLSLVPGNGSAAQGEFLTLDILVNDAAGVVGCSFTLHYPQDVLIPDKIPVTTTFFN